MKERSDLQMLVKEFADKKVDSYIILTKDIDYTPLDGQSRYKLDTKNVVMEALCPDEERKKQIVAIGEKLISLCFRKKKVLKFGSSDRRIFIFEAYRDFLIIIRNHGQGHYWQTYHITITIPKYYDKF